MEILNDFKTSVKKALKEIDKDFDKYDGLVICGTHSPKDMDDFIEKIRLARETKRPILGICMGMQLMVIEWARNVLGLIEATTEELGGGLPVIIKMPTLRVGTFNIDGRLESHWHHYKVDPRFIKFMEGWTITIADGKMW